MDLERLTRPEYLSDRELKEVLLSYHVPVSDSMARCHVLELFKKVARPLPQREKPSTHDEGLRLSKNAGKIQEQTMDVDDFDTDAQPPKLSPPSMSPLRNQFDDIVRISDRKTDTSRKRLSSSQLPDGSCKNRKLSE